MFHIKTLRKRKSVGVTEKYRTGPKPKKRLPYYCLIFIFLFSIIALYFYNSYIIVKGSGLVTGEIVTVRSPIKGNIITITKEGTPFEKGKILVKIKPYIIHDDSKWLEKKRKIIKSNYQEVESTIKQLTKEKKQLEKELEKIESLYKRRIISLSDKIPVVSLVKNLEIQIASLKQKKKSLKIELLDTEEKLRASREKSSPYKYISSQSGFVLEKYVTLDSIVFPGDDILRISTGKPKFILAYFSLKELDSIKLGNPVTIELPNGRKIKGNISKIFPEAGYKPSFILRTFERREMALKVLIKPLDTKDLILRSPVKIYLKKKIKFF